VTFDPGPAPSAQPFLSLLVPVYRTPPEFLLAMLDSVRAQTDPDWQLVLVDDGSDDPVLTAVLTAAAEDPRVVLDTRPGNAGIVATTAAALELARGEFIGFLDHDDLLAPTAVQRVRAAVAADPDIDVLYTDEDQLHPDGRYQAAFAKPDFSPERLRGQMYLGHLVAYRRSLIEQVGGIRAGYDGSQDYDLALRATERARTVAHVPEVLYHWRIHPGSVSHGEGNEPVFAAARRALADHLARVGIDGTVEQVHPVGVYRIRRRLRGTPLVSIIIPTRGSTGYVRGAQRSLVIHAVQSLIERTSYPGYEIVLMADADTPTAVLDRLTELAGSRLHVVGYQGRFNFSAKINRGVARASGDLLLLLNDDVEVLSPDWLETMVALAQAPDVGMVGAKLLYEDDTIQHLGHLYQGTDAAHLAAGAPADWPGMQADLLVEREVSGVTAACALLRREVFEQVGGLSFQLPINFNDVDLSMKITEAGYRILITPHAVLYHFESKSRKRTVTESEVRVLRGRWDRRLVIDPFWRYDPAAVAEQIGRYRAQ